MSHIEIKKVNDEEYVSFVKKSRLMGRTFRISEHIGKNVPTINMQDYMMKNLDRISDKELSLRKPLLDDLDISYSAKILHDVELLSITLDNLMEAKNNTEPVLVEFAKEFIFNSNNIEGSRIPADEVKKIVETGDSRYENANEVKEVFNSINAMDYIRSGFKFNIPSIKRLYYILTKDLLMQNGMPYPRGFKTERNVVNNMETVSPDQVELELSELLKYYMKNKKKVHPLKLALYFHLKYEGIHPFLDGNGRTGRLIMNKILMTNGYFPIIIFSANSTAYYNAIAKGLTSRNKRGYYQFMLEQAEKTYKEFITVVRGY